MSASSRSRRIAAAEASDIAFILPPANPDLQPSRFAQHPVIADDGDTTGQRRLHATFANSALKRLEGIQRRKWRAAFFGLDQMDKAVVVEPQRKIADALGFFGVQFLEHFFDQSRVAIG